MEVFPVLSFTLFLTTFFAAADQPQFPAIGNHIVYADAQNDRANFIPKDMTLSPKECQ
jgi:hypothetical protein